MQDDMKSRRVGGGLLGAGALTFLLYAATHPHDEASATLTGAVASMAAQPAWVLSHVIGLLALTLIGAGMVTLVRSHRFAESPRLHWWGWAVVAAVVIGAIETIPHILVASESAALAAGGPTPITDLHLALQILFTPAYGLSIAGLAVAGFGRVAHPAVCLLGVVGGVFLAPAGPMLWLTGDPMFGLLFIPANGTWLFLLGVSVRSWRSATVAPIAAPAA